MPSHSGAADMSASSSSFSSSSPRSPRWKTCSLRSSWAVAAGCPGASGGRAPSRAWTPSASSPIRVVSRASFRADSSSASPSRVRSPMIRLSSSPTSRPATSIPRPHSKSSTCWLPSLTAARLSSMSPTTARWPLAPLPASNCSTAASSPQTVPTPSWRISLAWGRSWDARHNGGSIMTRLFSARLRKSLADVTRRKGRTLLVVLGIFIGVAGLTAINFTDDALVGAFAFTRGYQATQPDFQLTVDRADPSLLPALQSVADVKAVQDVSSFSACWQTVSTGCAASIDIFSAPDLRHIPITPFQLTAGRYPGVGEIVMEQGDQGLHDVSIGDVITLHVGDQMAQARVVGFARTPGADPH